MARRPISGTSIARTRPDLVRLEDRYCPAITFQLDYRYDTVGYFTPARKELLERAAATIGEQLTDTWAAIQPGGENKWTAAFDNPQDGGQVKLANLAVPANTAIIFMGSKELQGAAAEASPENVAKDLTGSGDFIRAVRARGQAGILDTDNNFLPDGEQTDTAFWGGTVTFDRNTEFLEDLALGPKNPNAPNAPDEDFFDVALHEFGHIFGIGPSNVYGKYLDIQNGQSVFTGPAVQARAGGPVPADSAHLNIAGKDGGLPNVMNGGAYDPIRRDLWCRLDMAALKDIGWQPLTDTDGTIGTATATGFTAGSAGYAKAAAVDTRVDVDVYKFTATAGSKVTIATSKSAGLAAVDTYLRVFDGAGKELDKDDNSGADAKYSKLVFSVPADGDYYVGVSSAPNTAYQPEDKEAFQRTIAGTTGGYTLAIGDPVLGPATPPTVATGTTPAVDATYLGGNKYEFTVVYTATTTGTEIDAGTLAAANVTVTGPGAYSAPITFVKADPAPGNAPTVTATYRFVPPGGTWDAGDNGDYVIAVAGAQVKDTAGNAAVAATLKTVTVALVAPPADTAAPTAALAAAANVAGVAGELNPTYSFTVTYADDVAVNAGSFDDKDVRVTGPNGFDALATFASSDPAGNGTPRTARYILTPPGGFTPAGNGTYTIAVEPGQVFDTAGNKVAAGTLGTFTVTVTAADQTPPTATLAAAASVGAANGGQTAYDFTVTYADNVAVKADSFGGQNVRVTGPNGFTAFAAFVSADPAGDGTPRTATYRLTPPGGSWTSAGNGTYTIFMQGNQVLDTSSNDVSAGTLGTFAVNIPVPDTTAPTAKLAGAATVTALAAQYDFTVTYADDVALNAATFDGNDIRVTGPGGFNALAAFVSAAPGGNSASVTYRLAPAGGFSNAANGTYTISVEAGQVLDTSKNAVAAANLGTFAVNVSPAVVPPKPALVGVPLYAVGSDAGAPATVQFFNADKTARLIDPLTPFGAFTGGIRTASADFNDDGVADIVAGTGPGRATRVVVIDGKTLAELFAVDPFEASFTGGVYVSAGDLNGDGRADLIITPDEGGGPRVDAYSGAGFGKFVSFFGIDDPNFRGGARASTGDMNGDGRADLVVVAGFGGGPRVAAFDGKSVGGTPVKIFGDFFAFEQTLRNGIFVTVGDLNGDGFADLICGGGPGGGPRVLAFSGKALTAAGNQTETQLANFFGGDPNSRGGIRLSVKDLDGDNRADLVVGAGAGAGSRVTSYLGKAIPTDGPPAENYAFEAVGGFKGGVFVG
jgi:hypothetical protein